MKRLRIYLDTSIINFLYADDAPEKRDITLDFFETRLQTYDVSISDVVLFEIGNTKTPEKRKLLTDAMHVAISTVFEFDILLSWNFEHLANINKQIQVNALNEKRGYLKRLNLLTPLGVMSNEDKGE